MGTLSCVLGSSFPAPAGQVSLLVLGEGAYSLSQTLSKPLLWDQDKGLETHVWFTAPGCIA